MIILCLFSFFLCLLFPEISVEGIRRGISLSAVQVIPSLYPFILLTTLFKALSRGSKNTRHLSLTAGFLSGYPLGAKVVAEQYGTDGRFTPQAMLVICNNPSPAYMISFVGLESLGRPSLGLIMYLSILAANFLTGIIVSQFSSRKKISVSEFSLHTQSVPPEMPLIDTVFQDAFTTIVRICGYILAASVAAAFIEKIPFLPAFVQALLTGSLEMTSAIKLLSPLDLPTIFKIPLMTGLISFGGLSIFAQTKSMIGSRNLSIKKYMTHKAIASAIASLVMYLLLI